MEKKFRILGMHREREKCYLNYNVGQKEEIQLTSFYKRDQDSRQCQ